MSRNERLYLDDIRLCCQKILRYTSGSTRQALMENEMAVDALVRNLEIIGEAAKHVSEATRAQTVDIPWRRIAGLRDILIHAYFRLDEDILWDIVVAEIPRLLPEVERLLDAS